jgi:hypothetical protein
VDWAQVEIDRLTDLARREQNAEQCGPDFYGFTPLVPDQPNQQCLSFRLVYAATTPPEARRSLEEALVHHGCSLEHADPAVLDGAISCSAVSQQGTQSIKKVRALLRRSAAREGITYIDAHERWPKPGPRRRKHA